MTLVAKELYGDSPVPKSLHFAKKSHDFWYLRGKYVEAIDSEMICFITQKQPPILKLE